MYTFSLCSSPSRQTPSVMAARYAIIAPASPTSIGKIPSDTFSLASASASQSPTKPKRKQYKKHPPITHIIDEAIYEKSAPRKGLSLAAIKKFMHEKYDLNAKRLAWRVREHIKESLQNGRFIQATGRGANGSFRLAGNVRKSLNRKRDLKVGKSKSFKLNMNMSAMNRMRKAPSVGPSSNHKKEKKKSGVRTTRQNVK